MNVRPRRRVPGLVVLCVFALAGCTRVLVQSAPAIPLAEGAVRAAGKAYPPEVELGFRLWFEPRLSANNRMTCATCHQSIRGFSNGQANAVGVTGVHGSRNVPTIYGLNSSPLLFWDGRATSLEAQALGPIQNPIEMGSQLADVVAKLDQTSYYHAKFPQAQGQGVTSTGIASALAAFERALQVAPSPYDRWLAGEQDVLTDSQRRGQQLFTGKAACASCHVGPDLTDGAFHNMGVGVAAATPDLGRYLVTGAPADRGAFKTPSLRNVALTAPYMHDGSIADLPGVLEFLTTGSHPDPLAVTLALSPAEKADMLAFLNALGSPDNLKDIGQSPGVLTP